MFQSYILLFFVVCGSAVNAFPSVESARSAPIVHGCGITPPPLLRDEGAASAIDLTPLYQTLEIQAEAIKSLTQSLEAVSSLQKEVEELYQARFERTPMMTPAPAPSCASDKFVTSAINAAVLPLKQMIRELNQTVMEQMPTTTTTTTTTPTPESTPTPETTPTSETTPTPETTPTSETTPTPETTPTSETTTTPETTPTSETTPTPETTPTSETTPTPETTPMSETTPTPETTPTSETSPTPETPPTPMTTRDCPSDYLYNKEMDSCYKRHRTAVRWTVADATCRDEGAHLAVINSIREGRVLVDMMQAERWGWTYIGVYKDDGVWVTVTGESFIQAAGYDPWQHPDWPANGLDRRYVLFYDKGAVNVADNENHHFICEKKPK